MFQICSTEAILGWSFGGVVAYQAAQLLAKIGFLVKGLVLIDSPYPRKHQPLPKEVIGHVLGRPISGIHDEALKIATEFQQNASLLAAYEPMDFDGSKHAKIRTVYLRSQETFDTETVCGVRYDWLNSQKCKDAAIHGWEALVGDHIEVFPITGNHFQPFTTAHVIPPTILGVFFFQKLTVFRSTRRPPNSGRLANILRPLNRPYPLSYRKTIRRLFTKIF